MTDTTDEDEHFFDLAQLRGALDANPTVAGLSALAEEFPPGDGFPEDYRAGDERNAMRASCAVSAVLAYAKRTRSEDQPPEQVIQDLLGDLAHLTDVLDVSASFGDGDTRYMEEVNGE